MSFSSVVILASDVLRDVRTVSTTEPQRSFPNMSTTFHTSISVLWISLFARVASVDTVSRREIRSLTRPSAVASLFLMVVVSFSLDLPPPDEVTVVDVTVDEEEEEEELAKVRESIHKCATTIRTKEQENRWNRDAMLWMKARVAFAQG